MLAGLPVATSTPREADAAKTTRVSTVPSEATAAATNTRPSSASSNLTQVTTDLDTEDELLAKEIAPLETDRVSSHLSTEVGLSDVMVSLPSPTRTAPPPLPTSAPPMFDEDSFITRQRQDR